MALFLSSSLRASFFVGVTWLGRAIQVLFLKLPCSFPEAVGRWAYTLAIGDPDPGRGAHSAFIAVLKSRIYVFHV